jgi:hypothetical protein
MNRRRIALRLVAARDARKMHPRGRDSPKLREWIDRATTRDHRAHEIRASYENSRNARI